MRKILKLFEQGNVSISGLIGSGKDMLMGNVIVRRGLPYVSNTNYGGKWIPFDPKALNCQNTWRNFITGNLRRYVYPYEDGTDIYLADGGVYFPSQFCNDLNKDYGYLATFMALSRHFGSRFHYNVQNLNRMYDKVREQSDLYIRCIWTKVLFGFLVIQKVIIYEKYESCVNRVPPFRLRKPLLNPDRIQQWEIQSMNYEISHGVVEPRILIYINRSTYNTRIFKEMLENAPE